MIGEIDKDYYCSGNYIYGGGIYCSKCFTQFTCEYLRKEKKCSCYHRKHPTPEQYKEEYGEEVPDNMPLMDRILRNDGLKGKYTEWSLSFWGTVKKFGYPVEVMGPFIGCKTQVIVCCTPYGKPDDEWSPE